MNKVKSYILLASINLAVSPAITQAYQISPNPNPVASTIIVNTSGATNSVNYINSGFLQLDNGGILNNNIGGPLYNYGTLNVNLGGILNNFDFIDGNLTNSGTIINNGRLGDNIIGSMVYLTNNTGGILNSSGSIYGVLINSGTINNNGILGVTWFGSNLINNAGGKVNNNGSIWADQLDNSGTLNNFGGIGTDASSINNYAGGTVNNFGNMSTNARGHGGSTNNSGTLNNFGSLGGVGRIINNSGGTLNNYSSSTVMYGGMTNNIGGNVNNYGNITLPFDPNNFRSPNLDNYGILNNYGTLNILTNDYSSVNSGTLNNYGILNNSNSHTLNNSGIVNNSGVITGTGTYIQGAGQTINNGYLSQASIQINGGSLSGTGVVAGNVIIGSGGSIMPGNSPGTMTIIGNLSSSGNLEFEIGGLLTGQYDVLQIFNGNANFTGGNIQFDFINGFNAAAGNSWDFLTANNITGWDTLGFTFNGLGTGLGWKFTQLNSGVERLTITAVPEPETYSMILAGLGLIGFIVLRRRRE